jgi:hypothetical protein
MALNLHPTDLSDIEKIATAIHFNVHLRNGPAEKINREAPTLIEAVKIADELGATASGKKAMIYAVTPEKMTVHVPADMIEEARKDAAEAKGLTAIEFARLSAIITGGGYKRSNSKAAAEARFIKIATEAGIANAADLAKGPFDMAEHVIRENIAGKALTIAEVKAMKGGAATEPSKALRQRNREPAARVSADQLFGVDPLGYKAARKARDGAAPAKADDYPVPAAAKATGKRAAILEAAQRGEIPDTPDFSAPTHARFRKKLAEIVAMVEAGDVAGLKAFTINPVSSSPKAMDKYRNLAVIALEARQQKDAA